MELTILCILTLMLGIMFSKLTSSTPPSKKYDANYLKFQMQRDEDRAIIQQEFEDRRFENAINREVNYRIAAKKDRMKIDKEYPHYDEWQKHMLQSYDTCIRVLNPLDFSQIIYHHDTAKYMNVDFRELIQQKVEEKLKNSV